MPRTKLAATTSMPEVSSSTWTSSCAALNSSTTSVMKPMASRLLKAKCTVSVPLPEQPAISAPVSTSPAPPAATRAVLLRFTDILVLSCAEIDSVTKSRQRI